MIQTIAAYAFVAAAASWTVWSFFLKGRMQRAGKPAAGCGDGCSCSD